MRWCPDGDFWRHFCLSAFPASRVQQVSDLHLKFALRPHHGCLPYFGTWCGLSANLECRSEMCCTWLAENTGRRKSPSGHHPTTLSDYIFATNACIDNRKKIVKEQYLLHMSPQYGELRPTSGWDRFVSLGHPSYFQRFPRVGSVTARHIVVGVSQTLRRWTEGATYVRQGDHHVGHWPTFLVNHEILCVLATPTASDN